MTPQRKLDALGAVVPLLQAVKDPRKRIAAILHVRAGLASVDARLVSLLTAAIRELRDSDPRPTWDEIGDLLHLTKQRAYQLANTKDTE